MKRLLALPLLLLACSCGLRPLYGGGGHGVVAQSLQSIAIAPIPGRAGWLVRTALEDRLHSGPETTPRYRLEVELDDQIAGFGLRLDNAITRERRTLRARYRLVDAQVGTVLLDATAGSDSGIDVVSSEYATVAAEQSALERVSKEVADQIVSRVALYIAHTSDGGGGPGQ
ncbi:MAG: LPS assembly lipoprotein LptE [Sphingomonadales bacterium]